MHDNVRFDMLHNPHLGLASTLSELYDLPKSMADCVVPQEYGTTLVEKRGMLVMIMCVSLNSGDSIDSCFHFRHRLQDVWKPP